MGMMAERVLARYLAAYKKRDPNLVPVENTKTERTVYVLPETLKEEPGRFKKIPESELDSDGNEAPMFHPGQPRLPKKPQKPRKPEIPRDPPPAPIHPPKPPKPNLPPKKPRPVKPVKPPKVPEPSPKPKYERREKYLYPGLEARVVEKYLRSLAASSNMPRTGRACKERPSWGSSGLRFWCSHRLFGVVYSVANEVGTTLPTTSQRLDAILSPLFAGLISGLEGSNPHPRLGPNAHRDYTCDPPVCCRDERSEGFGLKKRAGKPSCAGGVAWKQVAFSGSET
jgi:hypothetical protein